MASARIILRPTVSRTPDIHSHLLTLIGCKYSLTAFKIKSIRAGATHMRRPALQAGAEFWGALNSEK